MNLNPPYKVRAFLYVILMLGSPIVMYLQTVHRIGESEVNLWLTLSTAIALMAGLNVRPDANGR